MQHSVTPYLAFFNSHTSMRASPMLRVPLIPFGSGGSSPSIWLAVECAAHYGARVQGARHWLPVSAASADTVAQPSLQDITCRAPPKATNDQLSAAVLQQEGRGAAGVEHARTSEPRCRRTNAGSIGQPADATRCSATTVIECDFSCQIRALLPLASALRVAVSSILVQLVIARGRAVRGKKTCMEKKS